ncbi:MAG: phosphatase PAP2 family protein [Candidatus Nanopelagicales bacterium]
MPAVPDPLRLTAGRVGRDSWVRASITFALLALAGVVLLFLANLAVATAYQSLAVRGASAGLDQWALETSVSHRSPARESLVTAFTHLGSTAGMTVIATALALLAARVWRSWTPVLLMSVTAVGSVGLTVAGKDLFGRARPPVEMAVPPLERSPSFPSGHTLNATALIGMAACLFVLAIQRRRAQVGVICAAIAFVVAMGLSRVYLGHHWLTDVIAAWLLGLALLATVIAARRIGLSLRPHAAPTSQRDAELESDGTAF